jgi:hypothetical protein
MEDIELMKKIRRRGDRIEILEETVTSSARRWEREGYIFCTARNCLLVTLYWFGISPRFLKRLYPNNPSSSDSINPASGVDGLRAGRREDTGGGV